MNILTFDIEEWFQLLDHPPLENISLWNSFESRIERNTERIIDFLESKNLNATFFCLGWVGEKYPHIIDYISKKGYEIGSHTSYHQLVYKHTPESFENDLKESIDILTNITGKKVKYFRAPGFSIGKDNLWAFEIISKAGIEIDCSVFPAARAHGGLPSYGFSGPSIIKYKDVELKELPISIYSYFNKSFVFSGGGYFRLFPYRLIKHWTKSSDYIMTYFHPRDFDTGQPIIKDLPLTRKFKSYVGIKSALKKLERWLNDFDFIDIDTADKKIDWSQVKKIKLL